MGYSGFPTIAYGCCSRSGSPSACGAGPGNTRASISYLHKRTHWRNMDRRDGIKRPELGRCQCMGVANRAKLPADRPNNCAVPDRNFNRAIIVIKGETGCLRIKIGQKALLLLAFQAELPAGKLRPAPAADST